MQVINWTKPKMLISDKGKHIRSIDDVYTPAKYNEQGELIEPEHLPYYTSVIFLADNFDESKLNELYVEEEIEKEE